MLVLNAFLSLVIMAFCPFEMTIPHVGRQMIKCLKAKFDADVVHVYMDNSGVNATSNCIMMVEH